MNAIEEHPHDAAEIAALAARLTDAELDQHQLEGAALERACRAAAPLIDHLGQLPQRTRDDVWPDRSCAETETTAFEWLAVHLVGDAEAMELFPRGNRGDYGGEGLWLDTEGQLRTITYEGSWSRWQGEAGFWRTTASVVDPADAAEAWSLDDLLVALETLVERAAKELPARTTAARQRIARLRRALDDGSHDAIEISLVALAEEYGVPLEECLEEHADALVEVYHDCDGWHAAARELPGLRDEDWAPPDDDAAARVRAAAKILPPTEVTS